MKGHIDVEGNELVDGVAKVAAEGNSSQEALLPPEWATSPLLASISALRQAFKMALHKQWQKAWSSSPHYVKISRIDPSLPSNKYKQIMAKLISPRHTGSNSFVWGGSQPLSAAHIQWQSLCQIPLWSFRHGTYASPI